MNIIINAVGATEYKKGLNVRYMSKPFELGGKKIVFECGHHTRGTVFPSIYETDADGLTTGNCDRMERSGYWKKYQYGFRVNEENLPEYSHAGIIEALCTIYPELKKDDTRIIFID